ncbi:hypothetical protein AMTRI_Chr12g237280 [Amborella trichopoda]
MSSASRTYHRRQCLPPRVGVSSMLRVCHRQRCLPPSAGLSFALCAYRRWRYISPPTKGCCCLPVSPTAMANVVSLLTPPPRAAAAMPNAAGTFLLLRLASSLRSLLFSFLLFSFD